MSRVMVGKSGEKSLQILMFIAAYGGPVSAKALSQELGMPLSSLYRYLKPLREWNLIEESSQQKALVVGPAALMLMHSYQMSQHRMPGIESVLNRLAYQTGELAAYLVPAGTQALCVSQKESQQALRCSFVTGRCQPLQKGASSKVMLAFMPQDRRNRILAHFGQQPEEWESELEQIRRDGYAISTSEIDPGVSGISAPVFKASKLIGAVSVMAPEHRIESDKQRIVLHVLQAARALPPEG